MSQFTDAWGGAWGASSAWGGSWGWAWGPLHEVEEHPEYHGGGRRRLADDAQLHRDHWEYMDRLREVRARAASDQAPVLPEGRGTASAVGAAESGQDIEARAMRGTVEVQAIPPSLAKLLGRPLMLAAMAVAIEEADE